jgi:hypothetical protein
MNTQKITDTARTLVTELALSWNLVLTFLGAWIKGNKRFRRRLAKVAALEK